MHERRRSICILLAGTSGTGKSTLAGLLAARLGITTLVSTDSVSCPDLSADAVAVPLQHPQKASAGLSMHQSVSPQLAQQQHLAGFIGWSAAAPAALPGVSLLWPQVRHMLRSFLPEDKNAVLWASTYQVSI